MEVSTLMIGSQTPDTVTDSIQNESQNKYKYFVFSETHFIFDYYNN